jgi:hypothetical protein
MTQPRVPVWTAGAADLAVLVLFVAIGRRSHDSGSATAGFLRVLWPFVVGLAAGWLVTGLAGAPLAWRRALPAWLVTVGLGVTLRILVQGHEFKPAFTLVAVVFVGAGMLGWRGVVIGVRALGDRRADARSGGSLRQR